MAESKSKTDNSRDKVQISYPDYPLYNEVMTDNGSGNTVYIGSSVKSFRESKKHKGKYDLFKFPVLSKGIFTEGADDVTMKTESLIRHYKRCMLHAKFYIVEPDMDIEEICEKYQAEYVGTFGYQELVMVY